MMSDFVITRESENTNNELMHWKYISKKKVDGKWQYKYTKSGETKFRTDVTTGKTTHYRTPDTKVYERNGNGLLSKTSRVSTQFSSKEYREIGKIDQMATKANKWLNKMMSKHKGGKAVSKFDTKTITRGAAKIQSILSVSKAKKAMTKAIKK